jgi:hypothetical protein
MRQEASLLSEIPLKPYNYDISIMKKIALITFLLLICVTTVGAYSFQFIGPPKDSGSLSGSVGDVIRVEGVSENIPEGVTMTLHVTGPVNYYLTRPLVVQSGGYFSTSVETAGFREGTYRFEIRQNRDYPLSSSRNWFIVNLIDRSLLLTMTSPVRQIYNGDLEINGVVQDLSTGGVELTVYGSSGNYFGPEWISTDLNGRFYRIVSIDQPGTYSVRIADRAGLIDLVQIEVFKEVASQTVTPVSTPSSSKIVSASATASRENPAYFALRTLSGPATLSTSLGIDWIIEYIDESNQLHVVNDYGADKAETLSIDGSGGTVIIRAYPAGATEGTVHLYGQNVATLTVSSTASDRFGELRTPAATEAEESPVILLLPLLALAVVVLLMGKKP